MPDFNSVVDGRYELIGQIGAGGFSEVWSGRDQVLDRPVAVKLLHVSLAGHEETLRRFQAEARHAGLVSHENVARVYDYRGSAPAHPPYLVMELVEGESLDRELERGGAIGVARTLEVIAQAAAGLQAAHEVGLIHRDIKPSNLMVSKSGTVKVTDFGISQAAESVPLTRTGMILGSSGYLAPERAFGARATIASDLYALGVVAYECLSGAPPFKGTVLEVALAHCERPFPPLPPSVPPELAELVGQLTAKDQEDRPASASEVAARTADLHRKLAAPSTAALAAPPTAALAVAPAKAWAGFEAAESGSVPRGPRRVTAALPAQERRTGKRLAIGFGAAIAAVLIGLLAVGLSGTGDRQAGGSTPGTGGQSTQLAKAARVEVDRRVLIGEPIGFARAQLERRHLTVLIRWRVTAALAPGRVVAVGPAGKLRVGSRVTLTGAEAPPGQDRRPGRHGNGHAGKGPGGKGPGGHGPPGKDPGNGPGGQRSGQQRPGQR